MSEFRMPSLGADLDSATLVEWRVKVGDRVKRGDIVAEVETDKGLIEIETFEDGVVEELLVQPVTKVPIGTVLARISTGAAPAKRVSPAARAAAKELGVDVEKVAGSGPGGSVTREDVEKSSKPAPGDAMRRAIAAAMTRSKREIPHYYLATRVDVGRAMEWLSARNAAKPVTERLLPAVIQVKAVARALVEVPELNGHWVDGAFRKGAGVHVGFAISLRQGGLVAPAIRDADRKTLDELMRDLSDVVSRARAGSLKGSELTDPTITVTNLGELGAESAFAVITPPQVAIVGFGRVMDQPWVVEGKVVVRPVVTVSLSADHRASDGARGGRFLAAVERLLQKPEEL